jgi:WhiB family transcriptional regulator, redox-sensing transcriptional regulator
MPIGEPPKHLREEGNCRDVDTNIFYPEHGESFQAAMKMCSNCPVRRDCAEWATVNDEWGCWGGLTDEDRKIIRSHRPGSKRNGGPLEPEPWPVDLPHGAKKASIRAHLRRGEIPCDICHISWTKDYPAYVINQKNKIHKGMNGA